MSNPHVAPSGPFRDGAVELEPEIPGARHGHDWSAREDVVYGIRGDTERGHLGNPGDVDAVGQLPDGSWNGHDGLPTEAPPEAVKP